MVSTPAFASNTPLGISSRVFQQSRHASLLCSLAPERMNAQKNSEKNFHILHSGADVSGAISLPPRHYSVPVFGYFLEHLLNMRPLSVDKKDKYGSIFISNYFLAEMVHVLDYDTIVDIFRAPTVFRNSGAIKGFDVMFPGNLVGMDGIEHATKRALFSPAFARTLFPSYYPQIQKRSVKLWENVLQAFAQKKRVVLDPFFRRHYLGFIVNLSTGLDPDEQEIEWTRKLLQALQIGTITHNLGPIGKHAHEAKAELHRYLRSIVLDNLERYRDTITELRQQGGADGFGKRETSAMKQGLNLLTVLIATSSLDIQPGAEIDDVEVSRLAYDLSTTYLGGFATTAVTSLSSIFELGFNPELQKQLREEQEAVIAAHNGVREVTYEQVMRELPLLDSFITEVIRLHPAGAYMIRVANEDVDINGYLVPKDTLVKLDFIASHLNDSVFPNAKQFVPDRFMHNKAKPILSFGAPGSAHYCSGAALAKMQLKCVLSTLLRNYCFELDESQSKEFRYTPEVSPKSGVVVKHFSKY